MFCITSKTPEIHIQYVQHEAHLLAEHPLHAAGLSGPVAVPSEALRCDSKLPQSFTICCRASTRKLGASGLVLTDLQATQTSSSIFSAPIWQFSVRPDSAQSQQPIRSPRPQDGQAGEEVAQHERASGEASTSQAAQDPRSSRDLPYHRFAGRDNVILAALDQRLKPSEHDYVSPCCCWSYMLQDSGSVSGFLCWGILHAWITRLRQL